MSALNDVKNWRAASDGKSVLNGVDGSAKHVTALRADHLELLASDSATSIEDDLKTE